MMVKKKKRPFAFTAICEFTPELVRGDHTYEPLSEPAFVSVSEFSGRTAHSSSSAVCADSHRLLSSYSVLK